LIKYITSNESNLFKNEENLKRAFFIFFSDNGVNKDFLDMIIHNPQMITPKPESLDTISSHAGFIQEMVRVIYS